jgi:hypothetical protein
MDWPPQLVTARQLPPRSSWWCWLGCHIWEWGFECWEDPGLTPTGEDQGVLRYHARECLYCGRRQKMVFNPEHTAIRWVQAYPTHWDYTGIWGPIDAPRY